MAGQTAAVSRQTDRGRKKRAANEHTGDHEKAVETQKKAIVLLTPDEPRRDEYENHLAQFKAALADE